MVVNAAGRRPARLRRPRPGRRSCSRARGHDGSFPHVPGGSRESTTRSSRSSPSPRSPSRAAQAAIQARRRLAESSQHDDGGWAWGAEQQPRRSRHDRRRDPGAGRRRARGHGGASGRALEYLRAVQNPDGGFPEFPGEPESNVASTAWAVQGDLGRRREPRNLARAGRGREPLDYMASLQQADGHIRWKASQDLNGIWMTAYVAPAFAGQAWPIPTSRAPNDRRAAGSAGQGEGTQSGEGVIAGGGGRGAPLFSRPKPQSQGKTPGGARIVAQRRGGADHSGTHGAARTRRSPRATATCRSEEARPPTRPPPPVRPAAATGGSGGSGGGRRPRRRTCRRGRRGRAAGEVTGALVGAARGEPRLRRPGPARRRRRAAAEHPGRRSRSRAAALLCGLGGVGLERRGRAGGPCRDRRDRPRRRAGRDRHGAAGPGPDRRGR